MNDTDEKINFSWYWFDVSYGIHSVPYVYYNIIIKE